MSNSRKLVLALNAGSSSLKASVLRSEETIVSFLAERLNTNESTIYVSQKGSNKQEIPKLKDSRLTYDHAAALDTIIDYLKQHEMLNDVVAVGHRVVHGGTIFNDSAIVTDLSFEQIASVSHLAPLHNPHNLAGIRAIRNLLPEIPNVAVFDTSFHSTIPDVAYTYPLPQEYRLQDMRKYGFHGTSVNYVSQKATQLLKDAKIAPNTSNQEYQMIVCHLGNGASVTAVSGNKSMDTSMGFTPLSGLMMGTRCGSVDPSLVNFACHTLNKTVDEVLTDFNKKSGLKGMTRDGENDMRELLKRSKNGDEETQLAVDMFVYHLSQHIASSLVALEGPCDAIVFTAGIGEHSSEIRKRTIEQLRKFMPNLELNENRNMNDGKTSNGFISEEGSSGPAILDIATDEEAMIAKECIRLVV